MEKISRRRVLGGIAALIAASGGSALIAACASNAPGASSASSGTSTTGTSAGSAATPAAAAARTGGQVQLTAGSWSTDAPSRDFITKKLIPDFQKANPSISVQMVWHDVTKINEQLLAAFAAGTAPDLFQGGVSTFVAYYGAQGKIQPLDSFVKEWPIRSDYMDSTWKIGMYAGKVYGLTQTQDVQVLFYRKDFFQEVGLDPAKPPSTWEELVSAASKLVKYDGNKVTRAGYSVPTQSFSGVQSGWWPFVFQNGGGLLNADMTKAAVDAPESIEAMKFYHDLLYVHKLDAVGGIPTGSQASPIAVGTVAMGTFGSGAAIQDMKKLNPDKYQNLGAALPLKRKDQAAFQGGTLMMMSADTKHADPAWKFLSFWCTPDYLSAYAAAAQQLPPLKSLLEKPPIKGDALYETALKTAEFGRPWPSNPHHADYRLKIVAMSESFMLNKTTVEQATRDTAQQINAILAKK